MKIYYSISLVIWAITVFCGFSQEIKLPEERITGEDIRIEKTRVFPFPVPSFKVVFPELQIPVEEDITSKGYKTGEGYLSFSLGSNATIGNILYYNSSDDKADYAYNIETLVSEGYRDNSERKKIEASFQRTSLRNRFYIDILKGNMGLPGPEDHPFLNIERDFFSFNTAYTYTGNPSVVPSMNDRFYIIDSDEINFSCFNLAVDKLPFRFETGIERYDVFDEDFSSTSFYQSISATKNRWTLGGTLKAIERYDVRFLPSITYSINENLILTLTGTYRIPDLYRDIIQDEYKEISSYNIAPEEEYKVSLAFHKKFTDTDFHLNISPSYRDNSYVWADTDKNGLFEPYPVQYWQTSVNIELQHKFNDYIKLFFKGEKRFLSEEVDYYPEELFDTGLAVTYKGFSLNTWLSYTGERSFEEKELGSVPVVNAEIVFQNEMIEWGITVYNIADREYFKVPGYPAEGRNIMSFVRIFF